LFVILLTASWPSIYPFQNVKKLVHVFTIPTYRLCDVWQTNQVR